MGVLDPLWGLRSHFSTSSSIYAVPGLFVLLIESNFASATNNTKSRDKGNVKLHASHRVPTPQKVNNEFFVGSIKQQTVQVLLHSPPPTPRMGRSFIASYPQQYVP